MAPTVSVIVPTYDREDFLERAVRSVLDQTFDAFECIVVDDGSPGNVAEVIDSFDDPRLRLVSHDTNRGASAARNTGIDHAEGKYVAFLDDDDEWLPTKLETQVPLIERLPERVGMVYCWMDYFDDAGRVVHRQHPRLDGYVLPQVLDEQRLGGCPTLLVRRPVVEEIGGFDETLPRGNDGDFIRRVCRRYEVDYVPEVLVKVYVDHGRERITRQDAEGLRNAIRANEVKLRKFDEEFQRHPGRRANVYARLGWRYAQLDEYAESARYYRRALATSPFTPGVYENLALGIRDVLIDRIVRPRVTFLRS